MSETIRDKEGDERRAEIARRMTSMKPPRKPLRFNAKPFKAKLRPEGYVTGRPSKYDPAYCDVAVDAMARGHSVTGTAGLLRVSKDTIYEWMLQHSEFSAAIKVGKACRVAMLEHKLLSTDMGVGVTAAIFALKNADPDEYKDLFQQESRVSVQIEHVPDSELMQIIKSARRPPVTIDAAPIASQIASKTDQSE
jgi:hypothetical protein